MTWGSEIQALLFHPVEVLSGTYIPPDASGVIPYGSGPAVQAEIPAQSGQTWGDWLSSKFTGTGEAAGSFTGKTLAATLTPLLPILIILLVIYVVARVAAEKVIP